MHTLLTERRLLSFHKDVTKMLFSFSPDLICGVSHVEVVQHDFLKRMFTSFISAELVTHEIVHKIVARGKLTFSQLKQAIIRLKIAAAIYFRSIILLKYQLDKLCEYKQKCIPLHDCPLNLLSISMLVMITCIYRINTKYCLVEL